MTNGSPPPSVAPKNSTREERLDEFRDEMRHRRALGEMTLRGIQQSAKSPYLPVPWWQVEPGLVPYFVFWGAIWVCVLLWFDGERASYKESLKDPRNQRAGLEYIHVKLAQEEAQKEVGCREILKDGLAPKEVKAYCQDFLGERESTGGPYPIYCSEWVRLDGVPEIVKTRCRESFPPPSLTPKGDIEDLPQDSP